MTRLQFIFAATTGTFLLATASARATETTVEASADRATALVQAIEMPEPMAEPTAELMLERPDAIARIADFDRGSLQAAASDAQNASLEATAETLAEEPALEELADAPAEVAGGIAAEGETETISEGAIVERAAGDAVEPVEAAVTSDGSPDDAIARDVETIAEPIESSESTEIVEIAEAEPETREPSEITEADPEASSDAALPPELAAIADASRPEDGNIALSFSDNTPRPRELNPHPNPLRFPTFPVEVEIDTDRPISLEQAIELALRNNLTLQQSIIDIARQEQAVRQAEAAWWPELTLTSNLTWSESANSRISIERQRQLGTVSPLTDIEVTSWNTELRLSYDVFTSGNRDGNIRAARERLRLADLEVERQMEIVRLSVSEAYYDIQNTEQDVIIAESAVRNSEESLDDAQALERAGVGTQFDVLRAEVQLANDRQVLRQAQSDRLVARRSMARLLDLPQDAEVSAGDPVELAGIWELPLEETIVLAFRSRAELEQQIAQREIARQDRRVVRSATLPQISAFATVNLLDNSDDGVDELTEGYSAGVQLAWQLFDGGRTSAATRDRELVRESAELEFANQRNTVRLEVEQSYYQLEASLQNVSTSEEALTLAQESLELARLRFQAGVGTQTEVIDAQDDLTQAEGNRVAAILGYNRALASLRRAVGNHPLLDEVDPLLL